jgi:signal transduction histidine kinase
MNLKDLQIVFSKYLKYIILIVSFIISSNISNLSAQENPSPETQIKTFEYTNFQNEQIILDLRNENLKDNIFNIKSEWNFFPHKLLTGKEILSGYNEDIPYHIVAKQGQWKNYLNPEIVSKEKNPSFAVGTYIIQLKISKEDFTNDIALKIKGSGGAYKVFWNGELIGEEGDFLITESDAEIDLSYLENIYSISDFKEINVLAIQQSNFTHPRGGMWYSPKISKRTNLEKNINRNIALTSIIVGGLILLGLYQLFHFAVRRTNSRSLLFALFCFLMSLRLLSMSEVVLYFIMPQIPINLFLRFEYFGFYANLIVILYYIYYLVPKDKIFPIIYLHVVGLILLIPVAFVLFGSLYSFTNLLFYVQIIALLSSVVILVMLFQIFRFSKHGKHWLISSFLILLGFVVYDIVINLQKSTDDYLLSYGLLIFSFLQTIYLSTVSSEEQKEAEQGLKAAQYQLIQSEKLSTLGIMVAGVAHEINSPLGAIQSSSSSLEERLNRYWDKIPDLTQVINEGGFPKIQNWLNLSMHEKKVLSSKEERELKRKLLSSLEEQKLDDVEDIVDKLCDLGLYEIPESSIIELKESKLKYVKWALNWKEILNQIQNIHRASLRAGKIVLSLKTFTHFDPNAKSTEHNIIQSIENVIEVFHNAIKKGIDLNTDFQEIPTLLCYPDELTQVWTNLIHNAIQAMEGSGKLNITVCKEGFEGKEFISAQFEDTGKGVPKEIQDKIFDPFFTTKPVGEGTGLGLHITKQIIEKHNGIIQLESKPGHTKFKILIPIAEN